jgi:hypothetical protein
MPKDIQYLDFHVRIGYILPKDPPLTTTHAIEGIKESIRRSASANMITVESVEVVDVKEPDKV